VQGKRSRSKDYVDTWDHGFIRRDADGSRIYIIREKVQGRVYKKSTRATTLDAAQKEYERFQLDREGYVGGQGNAMGNERAVHLDEHLTLAYLTWCRDVRGNTARWLNKQKKYLAWWASALRKVNLRTARLVEDIEGAVGEELKPGEPGYSTRAKRIAIIKGLYSYMRLEKHARDRGFGISAGEDPVFGTLRVPQSDPNQRRIKDKAVPKRDVLRVIRALGGHWRDALMVQADTGWHVTEIERFTSGIPVVRDGREVDRLRGTIESPKQREPGVAGVLVCPESKAGGELRTAVGAKALAAAERLLEHGTFSVEKYGLAVKDACKRIGVEPFTPGRIRHSVATHAVDSGADIASVSTFLNHKSTATTRNFYAKFGVAKKPPSLLASTREKPTGGEA
jgi:integrase